jgi:hypothetical protein
MQVVFVAALHEFYMYFALYLSDCLFADLSGHLVVKVIGN